MTVGHSNECLDGGEAGKSLSFLLLVGLTDSLCRSQESSKWVLTRLQFQFGITGFDVSDLTSSSDAK